MKKITLLLVTLFACSVVFGQYASRQDAKNQVYGKKTNSVAISNKTTKNVEETYFTEGFEGDDLATLGWTTIDQDGDGNNWFVTTASDPNTGTKCASSASYVSPSALTPHNWMISPEVDLTSATGTLTLEWFAAAQDQSWTAEKYKVLLSTTNTDAASFTEELFEETLTATGVDGNKYFQRSVDISSFASNTVYVAFVHYDCTDNFRVNIDDVSIFQNTTIDAALTDITAPNHDSDCALTAAEDVTITIVNNGGEAISNFDVSYTIDGGTAVTETITESIAPAATYNYTFTTQADLSTLGTYEIVANVNLPDDSNADNNAQTLNITSGDAQITIHAMTDSGGGQSWYVVNVLTGDTVARRDIPWQWNVEVTENICVVDANCYTVIINDADGMVDGTAYVEVLYNDVQIGGSTTPDSFTENLVVENVGSGCAANDAGIIEVQQLYAGCYSTEVTLAVKVKNFGTEDITSVDVSCVMNDGTPVVETISETIESGAEYIHTFSGTMDLTTETSYSCVVSTVLEGDENTNNDSEEMEVIMIENISFTEAAGYSNGLAVDDNSDFLPFTIIDNNADDNEWAFMYTTSDNSEISAVFNTNGGAGDDYLILNCIDLVAGDFAVQFEYYKYGDSNHNMEVLLGTSQTIEDFTSIATMSDIANTDAESVTHPFSITEAGTYYIAFKATSAVTAEVNNYLILDNFVVSFFDDINNESTNNISIYPNPANDFINIENAENSNVSIINMLGQTVYRAQVQNNSEVINTSSLSEGTYVLRIENEGEVKTKKVNICR